MRLNVKLANQLNYISVFVTHWNQMKIGVKNGDKTIRAGLVFNPIVTVTERVYNYDTFKFIVDVGSSLGLCLGLSMLNFYDLIAMAFEFVTNKIICGKFKSVTSK